MKKSLRYLILAGALTSFLLFCENKPDVNSLEDKVVVGDTITHRIQLPLIDKKTIFNEYDLSLIGKDSTFTKAENEKYLEFCYPVDINKDKFPDGLFAYYDKDGDEIPEIVAYFENNRKIITPNGFHFEIKKEALALFIDLGGDQKIDYVLACKKEGKKFYFKMSFEEFEEWIKE